MRGWAAGSTEQFAPLTALLLSRVGADRFKMSCCAALTLSIRPSWTMAVLRHMRQQIFVQAAFADRPEGSSD